MLMLEVNVLKKNGDLVELRSQTVSKANSIIQKSRYDLTLPQQRIVLFLISQVRPTDDSFKVYDFSIPEFCKLIGITGAGKNYIDLKAALKAVADQSIYVEEDGTEKLIRWLDMVHIRKNSGTVQLRIHEEMRPYLLHLHSHFTRYELVWVLRFKSKYSPRLYEFLRSYHYNKLGVFERDFQIDELKRAVGGERYERWINFRQKVLEPSVSDINEFSDMVITWTPIKTGRQITGIHFTIQSKSQWELLKLRSDTDKALGLLPGQMTLWDQVHAQDAEL